MTICTHIKTSRKVQNLYLKKHQEIYKKGKINKSQLSKIQSKKKLTLHELRRSNVDETIFFRL